MFQQRVCLERFRMKVTRTLLKISEDEWVLKARRAEYNVAALAAEVPCSVKQLERFFVKHKGMNPHAWMTRLRTMVVVEVLRGESLVKEAAGEAGYRSIAHFCREFKKAHGITPSQAAYGIGFGNDGGVVSS